MSAYKHLTFQFVLLELLSVATHLIYRYAPLPSTRQPRRVFMEVSLSVAIAAFIKSKKKKERDKYSTVT